MRIPVRAAAVATALGLVLTGTMSVAVRNAEPAAAASHVGLHSLKARYGNLADAAANDALDRRVLDGIHARGTVDALVVYRSREVVARATAAAALAASSGQRTGAGETPATIARKARAVLAATTPTYRVTKRRALARAGGAASLLRDYGALPLQHVRFDSEAALLEMLNDPSVLGVGANERYRATADRNLELIHQPEVAALGDKGAGTHVAVLDTGVEYGRAAFGGCTSPGEGCKVAEARDFAPEDGQRDADPDKHGTSVAGIVLKVAPDTRIIAHDVFDGAGSSFAIIAEAINAVVASQGAPYNTRAINLSLGDGSHHTDPCDDPSDPVQAAFGQALAVGIQPVVAAGNDAFVNGSFVPGVARPACVPGALVVGAVYDSNVGPRTWNVFPNTCTDPTTQADQLACFSQGGPLVDVLAPGVRIRAAGTRLTGTSQAAPHVAGAVAVLAGSAPAASADAVRLAVTETGVGLTDPRTGETTNRLDLHQALLSLSRATVIGNGRVQLGVNQLGNLNVPRQAASSGGTRVLGLRYVPTGAEALGPGCPCEGWGVADASAPEVTGYANEATGTANLTLVRFGHTSRAAKSVVRVGSRLEVTHEFRPARRTRNLYEVRVSIKNISADPIGDLRYRRVMDFDVEPTAFSEHVTVQQGTSPRVRFTSDDGFASANPLAGSSSILFTGSAVDSGPTDHGALFDLGFGSLGPGATRRFRLYYGAADTERAAARSTRRIRAQAYSFGQPGTPEGATAGTPNTFIFALNRLG
jgi:hypothetical protein